MKEYITDLFWNKFLRLSPIILLGLFIAIFLSKNLPELGPDSWTYISFHPMRPPLYPAFVWLFHGLGPYQLLAAIWAQSIIIFASFLYAKNWLEKKLKLSGLLVFFILFSTTALTCIHYKVFQTIASEGLAVPLFIVTFFQFIDCFFSLNFKKFLWLCLFVNLLILTRAQFYYFYALLAVLIGWYAWKKIPIKKIFLCMLIVISTFFTTEIINRSYQYLMHGHFGNVPAIGEQLVVQALYLSNLDAAQYFKNPDEKRMFITIMKQLIDHQATIQSAPAIMVPPSFQIKNSYYTFAYNQISAVLNNTFKNDSVYEKDRILINISKVLYWNEAKENLIFYFWRISAFFGDIAFFVAFMMILASTLIYIFIKKIRTPSLDHIFAVVSLMTILVNLAFVSIFEPILPFYVLYCYFIIFCLAGILIKKLTTDNLCAV